MAKKRPLARSIRLIRPPDETGVGILCIATRAREASYAFKEIPCSIGGRGFVLHRLEPGEIYHVRVGKPEEISCECLGFLRHGNCKHIQGILTLLKQEAI
jgi:SWIM zinc finger